MLALWILLGLCAFLALLLLLPLALLIWAAVRKKKKE